MIKDVTVPEVGEKIESGTVVSVLVAEGDAVETDQGIIELETEKAVVEIPSPDKGVITKVLVKVGQQVKIGAVIARIDTEGTASAKKGKKAAEPAKEATAKKKSEEPFRPSVQFAVAATDEDLFPEEHVEIVEAKAKETEKSIEEPAFQPKNAPRDRAAVAASPSVRRLARELGADVENIPGSGPGDLITIDDVKDYVKHIVTGTRRTGSRGVGEPPLPDFSEWGEIEKRPLPRIRTIIADSTATSWSVIPHVTQFDRADITDLDKFRHQHGGAIENFGGKLTVTVMLLKVLAQALKEFPRFNASINLDSNEIIYKKHYHVGIATDTDRGLLIPVVRDVDQKSITQLSIELVELADRTRNKKISPDELAGGTFTISNQGSIGGTDFTPIVYWPQVAILGVSGASVQPVYENGALAPRLMLPMTLSYDHRINDGADAARFLKRLAQLLEAPLALFLDK